MPLADVLSAIKEIILDVRELPEEFEARNAFLKSRFPKLAQAECEDLAKIKPEQFQIYTGTIFSGERGVLAQHFPMTFALLHERFEILNGSDFDEYELTREIHRLAPWKSNLTLDLGKCFLQALKKNIFEVNQLAPEAQDLALLELLSLKIKRAADDERFLGDCFDTAQLCAFSIGELLSCKVIVPLFVERAEFSWNVVSTRTAFYTQDEKLNDEIKRGALIALGGRNLDGHVRWQNISKATDAMFKALLVKKTLKVEEAAAEFLDASEDFASEQEAFSAFMKEFLPLVESGALRVAR